MSGPYRPPHPGRTPEERMALDTIGWGDFSPRMSPQTRDALLEAGLIVEAGTQLRRDDAAEYHVAAYDMPLVIHATWANAVAITDQQITAIEALVSAGLAGIDGDA